MIIDLSHTIEPQMPVYPGTPAPELRDMGLFDEYGVYVQRMQFDGHTGTHLDTPAHLFAGGKSTGDLPPENFYGRAAIIDCREVPVNGVISGEKLNVVADWQTLYFLIFYSGWYEKWGHDAYFSNFPVLDKAVAQQLAASPIKGVGLDMISIDAIGAPLDNHHTFLAAGKIIIENLTNLEPLLGRHFDFACFPLKVQKGDGSPVRAVAIL